MDQTTARDETDRPMPMMAQDVGALTPDPAIVDPAEHNIVFTSLVTSDKDIVGLVAYSLYKQNKYDWLQAYSQLQGRMPDAAEAQAYLLGESTPRRLATYRHLAEAVLDGRGPDVSGVAARPESPRIGLERSSPVTAPSRIRIARGRSSFQLSSRAIVGLCIALFALLVLFWLLHSNAPLPPSTPVR